MSAFTIEIREYGEAVRAYTDTNVEKFKEEAKRMITDHIDRRSRQDRDEIKNIQISIHTVS